MDNSCEGMAYDAIHREVETKTFGLIHATTDNITRSVLDDLFDITFSKRTLFGTNEVLKGVIEK